MSELDRHMCPPSWDVWRPDEQEQEDCRPVYADEPGDAVEAWAHDDDARGADYRIIGGDDATVHVRRHGDTTSEPMVFEVSGESLPHYSARRKKKATPPSGPKEE